MRIPFSCTLLLIAALLQAPAAEAARRKAPAAPAASAAAEQEVLGEFERILDLWRDGRYDELYRRTGGRDGMEAFGRKLASAPRRPACCWEKIQDAQVSLRGGESATVRARLGFEESVPGTKFVTRSIRLKREGSAWTVSQSDLLALAQYSKRRTTYRYLPAQQK